MRHCERLVILAILFVFSYAPLDAQRIDSWEILSALDRTNSVIHQKDGRVIVGTDGGAYRLSSTGEIETVWRSNGELLDLSVTAVGEDPETGDIYFGSVTGNVSVLRTGGWWTYVGDLARVEKPERSITGFRFFNGEVYILSSFGVALYNRQDSTLRDTWTRLGSVPADTRVNDLLVLNDSLYVASQAGLSIAPLKGVDLADPLNWHTITDSLCGPEFHSLASKNGTLLVSTTSGVCTYSQGMLVSNTGTPTALIFAGSDSQLVGVSGTALYEVVSGGTFNPVTSFSVVASSVSIDSEGAITVGLERGGVAEVLGGTVRPILPDGPASNSFLDLAIGGEGALWVATGSDGASRLLENQWTNFTSEGREEITTNSIRTISSDDRGNVWAGSFGDGFFRFSVAGDVVTIDHFDESNSPLQDIPSAPGFTIAESVVSDQQGNVWALNWDNTDGRRNALYAYEYGTGEGFGIWTPHPFSGRFFSYTKTFRWIAVDLNGTKWLAGNDKPQGLLYYVNEGGADQPGVWNAITESDGLPKNDPTALLVDPDGELWVGTPAGVSILVNPFGVRRDGPTAAIFRDVTVLSDLFVWDIAVDALNRKWVATDRGAFLLSSDGTELIAQFTASNSPLSDDVVRSVVTNPTTGYVYLGTENGLNRLATEAIERTSSAELEISPQPFLPESDQLVRIEGLPSIATLKILTSDGRLVREYPSPGGAVAFWDGRDEEGQLVPSAVYYVLAESVLGEKVSGKVALVNR